MQWREKCCERLSRNRRQGYAWIGNHTTGNHMLCMTTARSSGPHPPLFRSNRLSLTSLARTPLSFNSSWKTPPWCPTYWNARVGTRHKFGLVTTFPYWAFPPLSNRGVGRGSKCSVFLESWSETYHKKCWVAGAISVILNMALGICRVRKGLAKSTWKVSDST